MTPPLLPHPAEKLLIFFTLFNVLHWNWIHFTLLNGAATKYNPWIVFSFFRIDVSILQRDVPKFFNPLAPQITLSRVILETVFYTPEWANFPYQGRSCGDCVYTIATLWITLEVRIPLQDWQIPLIFVKHLKTKYMTLKRLFCS